MGILSLRVDDSVLFSMIVPAHNEEGNIVPFLERAERAFSDLAAKGGVEIVFIDDGSTDGTYARLKECIAAWQGQCAIKAISFSRNFGKEAGIFAGLEHALGRFIGVIDADLQQQPEVMRAMLEELMGSDEYDCVAAYQEERKDSAFINWFSSKFYALLSSSSGMPVISDASDFRVFSRSMAEALLSMPERDRFSKGLFAWVGFRTLPYPYTPDERVAGTSKWGFKNLLKYAFNGLLAFTTAPLRIASVLGGLIAALSFLYLLVVVVQALLFGITTPGFTTLATLILLFGGLQLFFLGVLGEYLGKAYIQGKQRPIYLAREVADTRDR